jgi:tRNA(fMet)-specific endonuclease VapC
VVSSVSGSCWKRPGFPVPGRAASGEFDEAAATAFGQLRAALERQGKPIGPYDMLIAAQALSRGFVLVTDNVDEFGRIHGLRLENWRSA